MVSIIIPIFNAELYLKATLESITMQTFADFELLLIDDGSTDGSGEICDVYAKTDSRIKVYHVNNSGVSAARNFGLDHATGKYIWFVDSDDLATPQMLTYLVEDIESTGADLSICDTAFIGESATRPVLSEKTSMRRVEDLKKNIDRLVTGNDARKFLCVWDKLFRAENIKRWNLKYCNDMTIGEDTLFVMSYLFRCRLVSINDSKLYCYRVRPGSIMRAPISGLAQQAIKRHELISGLAYKYLPKEKADVISKMTLGEIMPTVITMGHQTIRMLKNQIKILRRADYPVRFHLNSNIRRNNNIAKIILFTPPCFAALFLFVGKSLSLARKRRKFQ